jgi:hypothetical protein
MPAAGSKRLDLRGPVPGCDWGGVCGAGDATWGPSGGDGFAAVCVVVVVVVGKHTARGQDRQEGGGWGFFFRLYGEQVGPGCLWRGSRRSFGEGGEDGWMDGWRRRDTGQCGKAI